MPPGLYLSSEQTNTSWSPTEYPGFYDPELSFMSGEERSRDSAEETSDMEEACEDMAELSPQDDDAMSDSMARRKMRRFRLTHQQTRFLVAEFTKQPHPDAAHRERLSREIPGLSPRQVQVWFQNRRAKIKRLNADDRNRVMRMRAMPEGFDNVQALRSPYGALHNTANPSRSPTIMEHGASQAPTINPLSMEYLGSRGHPSFGSLATGSGAVSPYRQGHPGKFERNLPAASPSSSTSSHQPVGGLAVHSSMSSGGHYGQAGSGPSSSRQPERSLHICTEFALPPARAGHFTPEKYASWMESMDYTRLTTSISNSSLGHGANLPQQGGRMGIEGGDLDQNDFMQQYALQSLSAPDASTFAHGSSSALSEGFGRSTASLSPGVQSHIAYRRTFSASPLSQMDSGNQNLRFPPRFSGAADLPTAGNSPAGGSDYVQQEPDGRYSQPPTAQTTPQGMEHGLNYSPADYFGPSFGDEVAQQSQGYPTNPAQWRPPVHRSTSS